MTHYKLIGKILNNLQKCKKWFALHIILYKRLKFQTKALFLKLNLKGVTGKKSKSISKNINFK